MKSIPLADMAAVIRSKNSGPYELTLDIMFKNEEYYLSVKEMNFFTRELIARTYAIPDESVTNVIYFDPAWAVKITLVRPVVSGAVGDTDVYGAQQHVPLVSLQVPVGNVS